MRDHDQREDYDDQPWKGRANVEALVRSPAAIMSALAMIQLGLSLVGCISGFVILVLNWIDPALFDEDVAWYEVLAAILASALCATINWLIIRGAARFRAFKNYRFVIMSVILFFFPLPLYYCGLVTFPVTIWAMVVLLNPNVRARFEAVARGKTQRIGE